MIKYLLAFNVLIKLDKLRSFLIISPCHVTMPLKFIFTLPLTFSPLESN